MSNVERNFKEAIELKDRLSKDHLAALYSLRGYFEQRGELSSKQEGLLFVIWTYATASRDGPLPVYVEPAAWDSVLAVIRAAEAVAFTAQTKPHRDLRTAIASMRGIKVLP